MEQLPYFLLLLKKNMLLCSIVTAGSLTNVDLSQVKHVAYTENFVELLDFPLGENQTFPTVRVMTGEEDINVTFSTTNPDYFEHPENYFQYTGPIRTRHPFAIFGHVSQSQDRKLGDFDVFGPNVPPATVYVGHSSLGGYTISISFYKFMLERHGMH